MIVYQVHEHWNTHFDDETDTWYRNKKEALAHYSSVLRDYRREWRDFERACVEELRESLSACEVDEPCHLLSMRVYRGELIPDKKGVIEALSGRFDSWELIREADFDILMGMPKKTWERLMEFTESLP
tara:strand:- start:677 stop:1060 length:384 start_codon:yes stop_codon:yes gene_type:complete